MSNVPTVESIGQAAFELEPNARPQLARLLVDSLVGLRAQDIEELWREKAERRDAEFDSGRVVGIPGDEVFARIRARLR